MAESPENRRLRLIGKLEQASPAISALRAAVNAGTLPKDELKLLVNRLWSPVKDVLILSIGLEGEPPKTAREVANRVAGVSQSNVPLIMEAGRQYLIACLESVDPTYSPSASGAIPNNPNQQQLYAQIMLMGHDDPKIATRLLTICRRKNIVDANSACAHTIKQWRHTPPTCGTTVLSLLQRVLAFFGQQLINSEEARTVHPNLAFLRQKLAGVAPSPAILLALTSDRLIQTTSLERLRAVPQDRWDEIIQPCSQIREQLRQHSDGGSREFIDYLVEQSSCLTRILLEACGISLAQIEASGAI